MERDYLIILFPDVITVESKCDNNHYYIIHCPFSFIFMIMFRTHTDNAYVFVQSEGITLTVIWFLQLV